MDDNRGGGDLRGNCYYLKAPHSFIGLPGKLKAQEEDHQGVGSIRGLKKDTRFAISPGGNGKEPKYH